MIKLKTAYIAPSAQVHNILCRRVFCGSYSTKELEYDNESFIWEDEQ